VSGLCVLERFDKLDGAVVANDLDFTGRAEEVEAIVDSDVRGAVEGAAGVERFEVTRDPEVAAGPEVVRFEVSRDEVVEGRDFEENDNENVGVSVGRKFFKAAVEVAEDLDVADGPEVLHAIDVTIDADFAEDLDVAFCVNEEQRCVSEDRADVEGAAGLGRVE